MAVAKEELIHRWRAIQDEVEDDPATSTSSYARSRLARAKKDWFSDCFEYLVGLPKQEHLWCSSSELMGPMLESLHGYFKDEDENIPFRSLWNRVSEELNVCTQCICQHHQAQACDDEYQVDSVDLPNVLRRLDEERITEHLKDINTKILFKEYNPASHSVEVVNVMFEVLTYPYLLDDQLLASEFQQFIELIDNSVEVTLSSNQQYPGVYALLFLKGGKARAVGLRLARSMGKLRGSSDLEPLQPLLKKYINFLEAEVLPNTDISRPRVQLERASVWLGFKSLLGFLEGPAFEEGIMERYPVLLNIVLSHVSDDSSDLSYAVSCLKVFFEMLGCKLWLRTTLSPSVMRNTLLGHCFHTREEKSHKEIFDLFLPFLQSLEALQDGQHEKQRRSILYFLLHQVTRSSNFTPLMRKNGCKIALLIVQRGYTMNPPCPPSECAHMWGPSLVSSIRDVSLHNSLRQPALDLIILIVISDASALIAFMLKHHLMVKSDNKFVDPIEEEDELPFCCDVEENDSSCWHEFKAQYKLTYQCDDWMCIPLLWYETFMQVDCSLLPVTFLKAVFWALSHVSLLEPGYTPESSVPVADWVSSHANEISSAFVWKLPSGSDDGGDGKDSKNSVKVSELMILLMRLFKRLSTHFVMLIERNELQKQWSWEPNMTESLILSLFDHNDIVRQTGRAILEHVSKSRILTAGLQFLCSCSTSMSAAFLGIKYALKLVQANPLLESFHNLHQLCFVVSKLLKEVVVRQQSNCEQGVNSSLGGGFLPSPFATFCQDAQPNSSGIVVDVKSWEKFSFLLSIVTWPFILKCLDEGKGFIDKKQYQITCVRILELVPIVYERLCHGSSIRICDEATGFPDLLDFTWLADLLHWGKSSLLVVTRHWKQSMILVLERLKIVHDGTTQSYIDAIGAVLSQVNIDFDKLEEKFVNFKSSILTKTAGFAKARVPLEMPCLASSFQSQIKLNKHDSNSPPKSDKQPSVILLSESEEEEASVADDSCKEVFSSGGVRSEHTENRRFLSEADRSSQVMETTDIGDINIQKQRKNIVDDAIVPSGVKLSASRVESTTSNVEKTHSHIVSVNMISLRKADDGKRTVSSHADDKSAKMSREKLQASSTSVSAQRPLLDSRKEGSGTKLLIFDDENDPLEHALDSRCRPQLPITKPAPSVALKRQVVEIGVPTKTRYGLANRVDSNRRRLKPPKLDIWFKEILEMDYFAVIGMAPSVDTAASAKLKEVPLCFESQYEYVDIFRPLVLEEFKAQLQKVYTEGSSDDLITGNLCIISVERVDDFILVRGRPDDNDSAVYRGCFDNDLVLLTREPLQNSVQSLHVLGKVERREKSGNQPLILTIRFYLSSTSVRSNKIRRVLVERSRWCINKVMSMTPQIREFQALSSLHDIPILPVILNPDVSSVKYSDREEIKLEKLSQPLQKVLKSSFNHSQLQAVGISTGTQSNKKDFELTLIQGPPGTGKTRTIVGIISALRDLCSEENRNSQRFVSNESKSSNNVPSNTRMRISESVAVARAWQDAAFARQLHNDSLKESKVTEHSCRTRVLLCAQSNAAVDELVSRISEGLFGSNGEIYKPFLVRVGNAKTVHPSSLPCFIDTLVDQRLAEESVKSGGTKSDLDAQSSASLRLKLENILDNIRRYEAKRKLMDGEVTDKSLPEEGNTKSKDDESDEICDETIGAKLNYLYGQKKEITVKLSAAQAQEKKLAEESRVLKRKVRQSILREAEIVVTTLSGCGGDIYEVCSESVSANKYKISEQTLFDVVIIDEAAQALEPATLIPLQLLKSTRTKCIMVGDPKQLPATVLSGVASKFSFECSMFERLQKAGYPVIMLTQQYRMHPEICRFPSLHFYENKLLDGVSASNKSVPFHNHPFLGPYMFFDITDGHEHYGRNAGAQSLCNESEADAATEILKCLKTKYPSELSGRKIGVITPYRNQVNLLRSRFNSAFEPEVVANIEFKTVDGFQGREVDILLLSTVRGFGDKHGTQGSIGFVADVRRMNVALTRARYSLWIVGNARMLQTNMHWADLIRNARERNLLVSVSRPYSSLFKRANPLSTESQHPGGLGSKRNEETSAHIEKPLQQRVEKNTTKGRGRFRETKSSTRWDKSVASDNNTVIASDVPEGVAGLGLKQNKHSADIGSNVQHRVERNPSKGRDRFREKSGTRSDKSVVSNNVCVASDLPDRRDPGIAEKRAEAAFRSEFPKRRDSETALVADCDVRRSIKTTKEAKSFNRSQDSKLNQANKCSSSSQKVKTTEDESLPYPCTGKSDKCAKQVDKNQASGLVGQNQLLARKRQREDVESLLSSSLISSKKPSSARGSNKK